MSAIRPNCPTATCGLASACARWARHEVRLAVLRWNVPHPPGEFGDLLARPFQAHWFGGCRLFSQADAGAPLGGGPDRPRHEPTAAIGADIEQHILDARRAERAFIAADAGVGCVGRQILLAAFAVGPELQHGFAPRLTWREPGRRRFDRLAP